LSFQVGFGSIVSKLGAKDLEERATGRLFFVIMEILHVRSLLLFFVNGFLLDINNK
jgi:hypothetical protein